MSNLYWLIISFLCIDIKIFLGDDEEEDNEVIDEEVDDYDDANGQINSYSGNENPLVAVGS